MHRGLRRSGFRDIELLRLRPTCQATSRESVGEDLQRDLAVELGVGGLPGLSHSALAEELRDLVRTKQLTRVLSAKRSLRRSAGGEYNARPAKKESTTTRIVSLRLVVPYWFWGGLCALLSVTALATGIWVFLSLSRTPAPIRGSL